MKEKRKQRGCCCMRSVKGNWRANTYMEMIDGKGEIREKGKKGKMEMARVTRMACDKRVLYLTDSARREWRI